MARKDCTTFKVGDIVCPLPKRIRSYEVSINNLRSARVLKTTRVSMWDSTTSTQRLECKVIDGNVKDDYGLRGVGRRFIVLNNAFKLHNNVNDYEIF